MKRTVLIALGLGLVVLVAISLFARDRAMEPRDAWYGFQVIGEWMDVNVLTFGAPEKQAKHLSFADRRLDELIRIAASATPDDCAAAACAVYAYERELASAEYMAEELSLLDHRFIPLIESVYSATLDDMQLLASKPQHPLRDRAWSAAAAYNGRAIKDLLQRHQHAAADTERYRGFVREYAAWIQSDSADLTDGQRGILAQAVAEIDSGRELEWAYDLLRSIR